VAGDNCTYLLGIVETGLRTAEFANLDKVKEKNYDKERFYIN
jgi:hypothetical protein